MYLIGYDIGSSSVKASLVEISSGKAVASAFYPKKEMEIVALQPGWAEQKPENWWDNLKLCTADILEKISGSSVAVSAIGISYQMHGLVCLAADGSVLRPSIIWCDSRAVPYGENAFADLGADKCLGHLLNSPGNFTASKLAWVKEHEPNIYQKINKIMLPGDYIAYRMTGEINSTVSGLSEGMMWDYQSKSVAKFLLDYYDFSPDLIPQLTPTFAEQGRLSVSAAAELGLKPGTPVTYRAGDQPNNALSLNVLNPGEIAATAGTSGVVYGVSDVVKYDPESRVNTFAHVNHSPLQTRLGTLLCVNGTGILNSWLKHQVAACDYAQMNERAAQAPAGSNGLLVFPFGNGAERMLGNRNPGASIHGLNFNIHNQNHLLRAAQEGIVFTFQYGLEIMETIGIRPSVIRAGHANMFLSPIFRQTLADISGATIELFDTDGSVGAALGAGIGAGIYTTGNAFAGLKKIAVIEPQQSGRHEINEAYTHWKITLNTLINNTK